MKNYLKFAIVLSLGLCSLYGCSLEYLEHGDKCPPDGSGAKLSYIYKDQNKIKADSGEYSSYFEKSLCPSEHICARDSENEFFCQVRCDQETQVACDGKCINPMTDHDYCGASNKDCDGYDCCRNAKKCDDSEVCSNGFCISKSCKGVSCVFGMLFDCENGEKVPKGKCDTNMCADEKSCSEAVCNQGDTKCMGGLLYTCKDGKNWESTRCSYAVCDDEGKKCADISSSRCKGNEKKCLTGAAVLSCENGYWKTPQMCLYGEFCNNGKCESVASACIENKCSIDNDEQHIFTECRDLIPQPPVPCLKGQVCNVTLGCVDCSPGTVECRGDDFYRCAQNGKWQVEHCGYDQKKCSISDGCYTCVEGTKECTGTSYRVCENGIWKETKCGNMQCDQNIGCYECKNGETKCDTMNVYYECKEYHWVQKDDCGAKKMSCSENNGCYNCTGNEKVCTDGAWMECDKGEFKIKQNCATEDVTKRCDPASGCYACELGETKCENGSFYKCDNKMKWKSDNCIENGQICTTEGCRFQNKCNDEHTIYYEYVGNVLNTHYCALERKYCDDEKGCVESTFSCATGGSHSIMIVTAKDSGKSANYDCNQNQYIKDEKVLLNFDEIEYKLRCNPELGCAEFYCDGKNHILYTSFDEPENCKAEYGEYCSNKYNGCIECDLDNFKPYCLDSETLITACVLEDDFVEAVEKECNSCKGSTCK